MASEKKSGPLADLIDELCRLPGLGARSAQRIALHLLDAPNEQVLELAEDIRKLKTSIRHCSVCFNLAQDDLCSI